MSLSLVSFGSASLHCSGYCWFTYLVASRRFFANLSYNFHGFVDGRYPYQRVVSVPLSLASSKFGQTSLTFF